eukprot:scaffold297926_cov23-Tisochrysis_lutea.AAC.1
MILSTGCVAQDLARLNLTGLMHRMQAPGTHACPFKEQGPKELLQIACKHKFLVSIVTIETNSMMHTIGVQGALLPILPFRSTSWIPSWADAPSLVVVGLGACMCVLILKSPRTSCCSLTGAPLRNSCRATAGRLTKVPLLLPMDPDRSASLDVSKIGSRGACSPKEGRRSTHCFPRNK